MSSAMRVPIANHTIPEELTWTILRLVNKLDNKP